jgi:hypothetical protein
MWIGHVRKCRPTLLSGAICYPIRVGTHAPISRKSPKPGIKNGLKSVEWRRAILKAPFARGDLSACRECGRVFVLSHHRQRYCGECGQGGVPLRAQTHRPCLAALAGVKPDHSFEITRSNQVYCPGSTCRKAVQDYLDAGGWIGYPKPDGTYAYRGQKTPRQRAAARWRGIADRPDLD